MSAFMVNTNVMAKVVTAILLNRDTFDGESTGRTAMLATPTNQQKEIGTQIGQKLFLMNCYRVRADCRVDRGRGHCGVQLARHQPQQPFSYVASCL